jgi:uncharacterized membrane protein (UPF0136 family)
MALGNGSDPSRIVAQIVSGIGFLGAGTIFRFGPSVKGLNNLLPAVGGMRSWYCYWDGSLFCCPVISFIYNAV